MLKPVKEWELRYEGIRPQPGTTSTRSVKIFGLISGASEIVTTAKREGPNIELEAVLRASGVRISHWQYHVNVGSPPSGTYPGHGPAVPLRLSGVAHRPTIRFGES